MSEHRITRRVGTLTVLFSLALLSGCAFEGRKLFSSRWAMDHPKYSERYGDPYSDNNLSKWSRMGQQMVDARFLSGTTGGYASTGVATQPRAAFGGELGVFTMPSSWSTVRAGAVGLLAEGLPNFLTGGLIGARFHMPSRLSPYVGLAAMGGYAETTTHADSSYVDGDGNLVMEGQEIPGPGVGLVAIAPELGISCWLTSRTRLSVNSSYWISSEGRDHDFLLLGLSFDTAPRGSETTDLPDDESPTDAEPLVPVDPYFYGIESEAPARTGTELDADASN